MTRDQARGQSALAVLLKGNHVEPLPYFVSGDGGEGEKLYDLERKRNDIIRDCAKRWAKIAKVSEKDFWTQSIPQALHDMLEAYDTPAAIIAAEAFLKRHGWKVERPKLDNGLAEVQQELNKFAADYFAKTIIDKTTGKPVTKETVAKRFK